MTNRDGLTAAALGVALLLTGAAGAHEGGSASARTYGRRTSPAWITFDAELIGAPDIRALSEHVADREEWDVTVLMNEVHGHVGPWSIVGCKMGQRALDLLEIGFQTATLISEGGAVPPRGCITDGMMLCSGATVGRGLVRLAEGPYAPAGTWVHGDHAVRLQARPFVAATIRDSIQAFIRDTGGTQSPEYWRRVRAFALQVWGDWDRDSLFVETWVPAPAPEAGSAP